MPKIEQAPLPDQTFSLYGLAYRAFGYLGLMTVFGTLLHGFRYDAAAPASNYLFNLLLFAAFTLPHLVMTRSWFKQAVWGNAGGSPRERRFYIFVTIVSWLTVYALHRPMPGPMLAMPEAIAGAVQFFGQIGLLFASFLFFEGTTRAMLDQLLGAPGASISHSHGPNTPLFTEGAYSQVRHPMYRAAVIGGLSSLLIHPQLGQLFWVGMLGATFIGFIPVEERQMLAARGDDYRKYMQRTPYRLLRFVW